MVHRPRSAEERYGSAEEKAKSDFSLLDPHEAAMRAAVSYELLSSNGGRLEVPFFGAIYHVRWPTGTVSRASCAEEPDITTRILLLHYLLTADGTPLASHWIAFRNLPGGLGYDAAFQQRANLRLARAFGSRAPAFKAAAQALNGERLAFGDISFQFRALPRVWLAVVLHVADEEFPASANVLFDGAASHYLPTEDLAVLAGSLAGRLVKAAQQP